MKIVGIAVLVAVLIGACWLSVQAAPPSIATMRAAMEGALAKGDDASARLQARKILEAARTLPASKIGPAEQYAIGLAHVQIAREALAAAVASGKLAAAQAETAKGLVAKLTPPQPPLIVIGHGEKINLESYLVPGKTTLVDFYSEYCPPCRQLGPHLAKLVETRQDLAVVKVDLNRPGQQGIDWGSPVARQFELDSIPSLRLYGPDGKLQSQGEEALTTVLGWCGIE